MVFTRRERAGGVALPETLVTINAPHSVVTWLVAIAVVAAVGTTPYANRVRGVTAGAQPAAAD